MAQDITELLSPRRKRRGWVPSGHAESASLIIKRLQTGNNLWIHEISRTLNQLMSSSKASSITTSPAVPKVKKEYTPNPYGPSSENRINAAAPGGSVKKSDYKTLSRDLNPHLKVEILHVISPKAASLTWSSAIAASDGGGGFITAGAAEKLLITHCRILNDDDDEKGDNLFTSSQGDLPQPVGHTQSLASDSQPGPDPSNKDAKPQTQHSEGLVIFSLTAHSRTSTGVSLVRKEQQRPLREGVPGSENIGSAVPTSLPGTNYDKSQPQLDFSNMAGKQEINNNRKGKKWSVFIPASIGDLHTQLRVNDEIWIWEPWSVIDLLKPEESRSALDVLHNDKEHNETERDEEGQAEKATEKALLVSRFAVLL